MQGSALRIRIWTLSLQPFLNCGVDEIVHEKISGVAKQRLELDKLEFGDTIVVIRMDRLGRSSRQLVELVEDFEARNINLVILDMNIDTRTPTGKFFLTIMAGFAEMERTIFCNTNYHTGHLEAAAFPFVETTLLSKHLFTSDSPNALQSPIPLQSRLLQQSNARSTSPK